MRDRRLRFGIICALINNVFLGIGTGIFLPILPLRLDMLGESPASIGMHAVASSLGVLVVAPFIGPWFGRYGAPAVIALGCAIAAAPTFFMAVTDGYWIWFVLRLAVSCGLAIHWVGCDAWLNQAAAEQNRGQILSYYVVSFSGGLAAGAALLDQFDLASNTPFLAAALCFAVGVVPIALAWRAAPSFTTSSKSASWRMVRIAPVLMAVGLLIGLADGAAYGLMPLFAIHSGLTENQAVWIMTTFLFGGAAMQLPIGWLSDKLDRRIVLILLATIAVVTTPLLPFVMHTSILVWVLAGLLGASAIGLYAVSLGVLGRRFTGGDMATANAVFVLCYEFGALTGAPVGGAMMDIFDAPGLMIVLGVAAFLVLLAAVLRGRRWDPA